MKSLVDRMSYAVVTFLSAFLLFLVEPLLGKFLLPWFGGTPAVWTTCLLFFQAVLLAGYLYAHLAQPFLSVRRQALLHGALLFASLLAIGWLAIRWEGPLLPGPHWRPATPETPVARILLLLALSVGGPFFLLSATSPLTQSWYAAEGGARPYRLYALSNAGSLLGLLAYPFVLEPALTLPGQALVWTALYGGAAAACVLLAGRVRRAAPEPAPTPRAAADADDAERPRWLPFLLWLLLAACASSMLLSVTNLLCQEVAPVPFLWVLPLLLYLVSFIVCFERPGAYVRNGYVPLCAVLTLAALTTRMLGVRLRIPAHVLSFGAFLFVFCMTCHGELVRLRPASRHLTAFYLAVALGGAAGGLFVGVVAPCVFLGYHEFHATLLAGWLLFALVFARDHGSALSAGDRRYAVTVLLVGAYIALRYLLPATPLGRAPVPPRAQTLIHLSAAAGLTALIFAVFGRSPAWRAPVWARLVFGGVLLFAECFLVSDVRAGREGVVASVRNFYGAVRVLDALAPDSRVPARNLVHGQINHGFQFLDAELGRQAVGYYVPESGVGLAITEHPRRRAGAGMRIGVTGLGAGGLAACARTNDVIRFYEINPAVIAWAAGSNALFSHVADCAGSVEIVPGDARLSLERERLAGAAGRFDVLVLDAFSSDAVPVHLLTTEAFAIYLAHLRDRDAVIAVNISNRFLDLRPLVFGVANRFGLAAELFYSEGRPPQATKSLWVLLSRNRAFFRQEAVRAQCRDYRPDAEVVWTDASSNLFRLLRWD